MNALPDYKILDFLDWIIANQSPQLNIGFVRECVMRDTHTKNALEDILPYAIEYIKQKKLNIKPYELIESIRFYLIYRYKSEKQSSEKIEMSLWQEPIQKNQNTYNHVNCAETTLLHMMIDFSTALHIQIDFLEWLLKQEIYANDVDKMSMPVFESLIKKFSLEQEENLDEKLLKKLLKDFKDISPCNFLNKLKRLLRVDSFGKDTEKLKSITELFNRYSNSHIIKCFFLPLAQDEMFKAFIDNSWIDLNALSKDYLDIYYSPSELSSSGYDIKDKFTSLDVAEDALPCLVLWNDSIDNSQYVELRDLQYDEIFHIIQNLVQNIKSGDDFNTLHIKSMNLANQKRKEHRPISVIEQKFNISDSTFKDSQIGTFGSSLIMENNIKNKEK